MVNNIFTIPNENLNLHECPLAVVKCVDWRVLETDLEFVSRCLGFKNFDLFAWPGAAKDVLKNNGFKKSFIEYVISVSIGLHKVKKLLLLWHWDCGAYGGSKAFSSAEEEKAAYLKDIATVKDMLSKELPDDLEIIMAYSKVGPQGLEYSIIE